MGFSSRVCPLCQHSVLSPHVTAAADWWSHAVVIRPDGSTASGLYNGYCGLIDRDGVEHATWGDDDCLVHLACYVAAGEPGYDALGASDWAPDQGFFIDRADYRHPEPTCMESVDGIAARRPGVGTKQDLVKLLGGGL